MLQSEEHSGQTQIDDSFPFRKREFRNQPVRSGSGVGNHNINVAKGRYSESGEVGYIFFLGDIAQASADGNTKFCTQ